MTPSTMWPEAPEPTADEIAARVTAERHDHVLLIRMERSAKHNALDAAMTLALDAALNTLDDDPDLWCGVLAARLPTFSAGTDIAAGPGDPTPRGGNYGVVRRSRSTPLIAAVDGPAHGGGFELVLACDMVVASRSTRFSLPEVGLGLVANCGALFRGPRALPPMVAREMLLTGDPLSAARAFHLGLVNQLVEAGEAEAAAMSLARRVCERSPAAVTATLHALDVALTEEDAHGWQATRAAEASIAGGADRTEGVAAFFERRSPRFTGR